MGTQHIIELNGKRYDTVTGEIVTTDLPQQTVAKKPVAPRTQSVDGFARGQLNALAGHKTEKSKTLMRGLVQKPTHLQPGSNTNHAPQPHRVHAAAVVSPVKLARAQSVSKNAMVQRFHTDSSGATPATKVRVPEKSQRVHLPAHVKPVQAGPLERGLAAASSHEQAKFKKPKPTARLAHRLRISPRMVSASALVLAVLLIGGFFAYQNIPNLNMRLASARSGVQGSLPHYQPAGFGLSGNIVYKPGEISLSYKSHSDDRSFTITQTASSWNSDTLRDNLVHDQQIASPITISDNGKTLYMYGDSNVTWTDSGIVYKIEGNSKLNSEQLQRLANSL